MWQGGFNFESFIASDPDVVNAIINLALILYAESTAAAAIAFPTISFEGYSKLVFLSEKFMILFIN
jgi:hypothetical protein